MTAVPSLRDKLQARIREAGPITFRDWMDAALYDSQHGYYRAPDRSPWGREGDYRTSPERTTLFAATLARYVLELYRELGEPSAWTIFEPGAGSGDFALQVVETLQDLDARSFKRCRYIIDERSEASRSKISERLGPFSERVQFCSIEAVEAFDGIVFANELLDAFPVHRVTTRDDKLLEYFVNVDETGAFHWQLGTVSNAEVHEYFRRIEIKPREGQIIEVNPAIEHWLKLLGAKLSRGFLILIDYGAESEELLQSPLRNSGTLRAIRRHQFIQDVFANPGKQDLTTTINWTYVRSVAADFGFAVREFLGQDKFLLKIGLLEELERRLRRASNEAEKMRITTEAREMILPTGMAAGFQVLVLTKNQ